MPKFTVTHPETGKKITLTGTAPPTEAELDEIFAQTATDAPSSIQPSRNMERETALAKGAPLSQQEASQYMDNRAAFAAEGGVSTFGGKKGGDTRKISYTDSGYRPNSKPSSLRDLAKNAVQDVVELPMAPVQMLSSLVNAPDTGKAAMDIVKSPLGFVPYVAEPVTGKTALENWGENPVYGALTLSALGKGAMSAFEAIPKPKGSTLEGIINAGIDKGIRPGVEGNRTFAQSTQYHNKAQQAVKTILDNHAQGALKLTDEYGEATGGLPKNLRQFSQAIDQSKRNIYEQYNQMAVQSGEAGATVDLSPIPNELMNVANNKALQKAAPGVADYARARAKAFSGYNAVTDGITSSKSNTFTAEEAQQAIAIYNQSLEAFNKNPSYDTASRAYIDSLIVNHLRKGLDASIEQATGPGYQALKNEYGALKSIEKDVSRRAIVDARKNPKGLLDFSDVFSGGQVVHGLMSMNPATVGTGIASKVIANFYKTINDPNRIVSNMFKKADKMYIPKERAEISPVQTAAQVPPDNSRYGTVNNAGISQPGPNLNQMGSVNTGGIIQPGPTVNQMGPVNTNGISQPGPKINSIGPVNTGVPITPQAQPNVMRGVNTGGLNAPARNQIASANLLGNASAKTKAQPTTWKEFLSANMGAAMKSEGSHAAAIRKLAKEWSNRTK